MKNGNVRLQSIQINNLKNVENGKIAFQSYTNIKNHTNNTYKPQKLSDIIGIYGQNGSGKTALVDAIQILKKVISGEALSKDIEYFINNNSNIAQLSSIFLIENNHNKFLVYYDLEIKRYNNNINISKEKLSYSVLLKGKRRNKIKIIDSNIEDNSAIFKPLCRYNEIVAKNRENMINLGVAKALAIREKKSFIFNIDSIKIFKEGFKDSYEYINIINSLNYFARFNLFVVKNEKLGIINMNHLLPLIFRVENKESIISGDYITLFETSLINEESYKLLEKIIKQINIVVRAVIPGLDIDIINYGKQLCEDGIMKRRIELVSIREGKKIPLKYESDGIKKIFSILSAMIAMYNNRGICLVVDELDAGIFEYLLGELLNVLEENAKGQFIFTSHNLRALEKLQKESIIFTTTNPKNRYVKLTNIKSNNNLRDFYLRVISLGGQKEEVYDNTNTFEINYAFRKAGRIIDEG